ncbi:hypothetical protein HDU97_000517 [Phlyctochytrium planicorne]|nr:hypothetical protein HDU97_000517 [Phlyctochytrium planicorne]
MAAAAVAAGPMQKSQQSSPTKKATVEGQQNKSLDRNPQFQGRLVNKTFLPQATSTSAPIVIKRPKDNETSQVRDKVLLQTLSRESKTVKRQETIMPARLATIGKHQSNDVKVDHAAAKMNKAPCKPKGPRRLMEHSERSFASLQTSSSTEIRTAEGPFADADYRKKAAQEARDQLEHQAIQYLHTISRGMSTSYTASELSTSASSNPPVNKAMMRLMAQEHPYGLRSKTNARHLDIPSATRKDSYETLYNTVSSKGDLPWLSASASRTESERNHAESMLRASSVKWADQRSDYRPHLDQVFGSAGSQISFPSSLRPVLPELELNRESTFTSVTEEKPLSKGAPLRWREAHPEPVTPKLGPYLEQFMMEMESNNNDSANDEEWDDGFALDDQMQQQGMPFPTITRGFPTLYGDVGLLGQRLTQEPRELIQPVYPVTYEREEEAPPITVLTVSSGETRTFEGPQLKDIDTLEQLPPSAVPRGATIFRQSIPIHRTWVFRLVLFLILLHGTAALLSVASSNDYLKPSRGMTDETESGLPLDPFNGTIDDEFQNTLTATQTAGVAFATAFSLLICATMRSRTGRPSKTCRLIGIAFAWSFMIVTVVFSARTLAGRSDRRDLRTQACLMASSPDTVVTHNVNFQNQKPFQRDLLLPKRAAIQQHRDGLCHTMGQTQTREVDSLRDETHFTLQEIKRLKHEFEKQSTDNCTISKDQFKQTLQNHVHCWSAGAQYLFLERLFDAFDLDGNHMIDFREFIQGLSAFMKGTPEEKLELSFRLYDIDKSGSIEPKELIKIMGQMYSAFYNEDQSERIREVVTRLFDDLDINGDGSLSLHEYKLMALKEPMIIDFLEQFLIVASDKPDN